MADDPPPDCDDGPTVEKVARDMIERHGGATAAAAFAREQGEIATEQGAGFSAEIWHEIADAIDRLRCLAAPLYLAALGGLLPILIGLANSMVPA